MPSPRQELPSRTNATHNGRDTQGAEQPLRIVVTSAAVEELRLRILAREAIPMLRRPHDYSAAARRQTARSLNCLLDSGGDREDDEADEEIEGEEDTDFRWSEEGGC